MTLLDWLRTLKGMVQKIMIQQLIIETYENQNGISDNQNTILQLPCNVFCMSLSLFENRISFVQENEFLCYVAEIGKRSPMFSFYNNFTCCKCLK